MDNARVAHRSWGVTWSLRPLARWESRSRKRPHYKLIVFGMEHELREIIMRVLLTEVVTGGHKDVHTEDIIRITDHLASTLSQTFDITRAAHSA